MGNIQSFIDLAVNRWPTLLAIVVVCLTAAFGPTINRTILLWGLPVVGDGNAEKRRMAYLAGARKLYSDGYQKVTTLPSQILILCLQENSSKMGSL